MPPYQGAYTRGGDPEAMFDEALRYLEPLMQLGKSVVDADFNDAALARLRARRRIIEMAIGDGSPNSGFAVEEAGAPANNFTIKGGDGTDNGAGRFFGAGYPAMLKDDVDYSGAYVADMVHIHPQVTAFTTLTLTDAAANWTVNEHAGKTLTPDVSLPGTTFTIVSNTATVITVSAGDLTAATSALKHYRIELTTPSGAPRVDEVFLDLFHDEVDENEDTNLVHTDLAPPQAAMNRLVLRQYVRVAEGAAAPANYTDADGHEHFIFLLATLSRPDATANILTAHIADERRVFTPGGSPLKVTEFDLAPGLLNVDELRFPNGSVTDLGGGVAQITPLNIQEVDGFPSFNINTLKVTNGTLTNAGGGVGVLDTGGGGGGGTGLVSHPTSLPIEFAGTTLPAEVTLGTATTAQSFPDGSTTGFKVEAKVPDDYDSGNLILSVVAQPSTAVGSPNNVMRMEMTAEIANLVTGTLDAASYPAANVDITLPDGATDITRIPLLTIAEGDFSSGDCIVFVVRRLGADGADVHTGALEAIGLDYSYLSKIATREVTQVVSIFDDTDETRSGPRTIDGTLSTFETLDYLTGVDEEQKFEVAVPDNWDEASPLQIRLACAMSTAQAFGIAELELVAEISDVSGGTLVTDGPRTYLLGPPNSTNPFRTPTLFEIPAALLGKGDFITVKLARRGGTGVNDDHGGTLKVIGALVTTAVVPTAGFRQLLVQSLYLERAAFSNVTANVTGIQDYPVFAGDFETWQILASSQAAGRIDVSFQGKLDVQSAQSAITRVEVPLMGDGSYQIKVFAEGSAGTPVYDSTLLASPAARTVFVITTGDFSGQPTGSGVYFIVVEATLDDTEELRVGRPYVTQE